MENISIDLHRSAGPATCAIIAIDRSGYEDLIKTVSCPVNTVATFI